MRRVTSVLTACVLCLAIGITPAFAERPQPANGRVAHQAAPAQSRAMSQTAASRAIADLSPLSIGMRLVSADDEIPGVELNYYGDQTGRVDAAGSANDVYMFFLEKGARIDFNLIPVTAGTGLNLNIFNYDATSISQPTKVSVFYPPYTPGFVSSANAYYFVNVRATSGATDYTLEWTITNSPNDNIPGVAPSAHTLVGWEDGHWDFDDVVALPLRKGDVLTANMVNYPMTNTSADWDADLYLYGPGASDVATDPYVVHSNNRGTTTEAFTYNATSAGNHYLDVFVYVGRGAYSLTWSVKPVRQSIKRTPSATKLTYKRKKGVVKYTLSAVFTDQFKLPVSGAKIYLQSSKNGKTKWTKRMTLTSSASGFVGVKVTAKSKSVKYYRWYRPKTSSTSAIAKTGAQKVTVK